MDIIVAGKSLEHGEIHRLQSEIIGAKDQAEVCMWIECGGGNVEPVFGCYETARLLLGDKLVTRAVGHVASMGVILYLAGFHRYIGKNSTIFIHPLSRCVSSETSWTQNDLRLITRRLKNLEQRYIAIVADRTGIDSRKVLKMMNKETLLDAVKATQLGFAHEIFG